MAGVFKITLTIGGSTWLVLGGFTDGFLAPWDLSRVCISAIEWCDVFVGDD